MLRELLLRDTGKNAKAPLINEVPEDKIEDEEGGESANKIDCSADKEIKNHLQQRKDAIRRKHW